MQLTPIGIATIAAIGAVAGASILFGAWALMPKAASGSWKLPDWVAEYLQSKRFYAVVVGAVTVVCRNHLGLDQAAVDRILVVAAMLIGADTLRPFQRKSKEPTNGN